jgi:predicted helicase
MVKEAAQKRLFGFELLPAPYVVAHLQLDLLLQRWQGPLDHDKGERAGVYLTNALTGWVPPEEPKTLLFPELAAERDAADRVKREAEILVVIGNPPYDGHPGLAVGEEKGLVEAYKTSKKAAKPEGRGRNELYMRFWRMAQRKIVEGHPDDDKAAELRPPRKDAQGIVCFITNYSWLNGRSHPAMRERFMEAFDRVTIDCMNGDKRETGKTTAEGLPDPSVFSTEHNREGIQVGTAISILERWPAKERKSGTDAEVRFREFWGKEKRAELLDSLVHPSKNPYQIIQPSLPRLIFRPYQVAANYDNWAGIDQLLAEKFAGAQTSRDDDLVDVDLDALKNRIAAFFNDSIPIGELREVCPTLLRASTDYHPAKTRKILVAKGIEAGRFVRFAYRPLDVRWLFWEGTTELLHRPSPDLVQHVFEGNFFLATQTMTRGEWFPPQFISCLGCLDLLDRGASLFPLYLQQQTASDDLSSVVREMPDLFAEQAGGVGDGSPKSNLTAFARDYLAGLGAQPEDLFFHIVAILHAPAYRTENAGALRQDWPRVPLPKDADALRAGAALGRQVAALLDPETDVRGVTSSPIREELRGLAELTAPKVFPPSNPKHGNFAVDLALTARWGYAGQGGVVMPGPGDVRGGTRGEGFVDVHLNATNRWKDVPVAVWN